MNLITNVLCVMCVGILRKYPMKMLTNISERLLIKYLRKGNLMTYKKKTLMVSAICDAAIFIFALIAIGFIVKTAHDFLVRYFGV